MFATLFHERQMIMPRDSGIKKVMVIGSGPIVIGQAAEFDYAGAQACRVLKDEGVEVVLVNSNPATIMTDHALASRIYLEPLTVETIKRIIEKERPDSLLASLGGQTGLTIGMKLAKEGFLSRFGVRLLGTSAETISKAEDRKLFAQTMEKIAQPIIPSAVAEKCDEARNIAKQIGYPVIIRPAFTLGGAGGGVAYDDIELVKIVKNGLLLSPIGQVLVERYIYGWKEIEFEVIRDNGGKAITVCSMENIDPVGIHTGDSIVVAPALTLAGKEYNMLRNAALDIIKELDIRGGCNVQFALNPHSFEYAVIEVNPRVSRSSALASKATGYPIAKVVVKIALGYDFKEIQNHLAPETNASFEPQLDYVAVKLPKWPFDKFAAASRTLGTQMKATGEVMALGVSFEAALMKAVRGAELPTDTLSHPETAAENDIMSKIAKRDDLRLFAIFEALSRGHEIEEIHELTKIDPWFLNKIKAIGDFEKLLAKQGTDSELCDFGRKLGYTDAAIARIGGKPCPAERQTAYKAVDTCAGAFRSEAVYFYSVNNGVCEASLLKSDKKKIIVLGSGPIRIGQGIEFDYSSVHCVWALKKLGYEVIIINNNPETVSTDFDTAHRLYFEPLTPEDVWDIIQLEKPEGVVVAFGGQTAIKLAKFLDSKGVKILGTSAQGIDTAEDRERFDHLLEEIAVKRPKGLTAKDKAGALKAAQELSYPVLLRPSYVIGGQNMVIAYNDEDAKRYLDVIFSRYVENPVLIDKYMPGIELEVDVISDGEDVLIPGVMEHIERAGVHSGDSIAVYPQFNISDKLLKEIVSCSEKLALALGTKGLVNIQYLISENELYVIEVNPRASRTVPYISKVTGVPMVELATRAMLGHKLKDFGYGTGLYKKPPYVAVKVPVFSFEKLSDVDSTLSPEMKSTGEVLGIGKNLKEALFKGLLSAGLKIKDARRGGGVLISVNTEDRFEIAGLAKKFDDLGLRIYTTDGNAREIASIGADIVIVEKLSDSNEILNLLDEGKIDYILYTAEHNRASVQDFIRLHRHAVGLGTACLTSLDTAGALADILAGRYNEKNTELVDLNNMRKEPLRLKFAKMQGTGNDYIYFENFDGAITCPESLSLEYSDRNYGIGGDGLVLVESSQIAQAKMRIFNSDGSEGKMAGNSIRCVGKLLYDRGHVQTEEISVETASGVRGLTLYPFDGKVGSVRVDMGKAWLSPEKIPVTLKGEKIISHSVIIGGAEYKITCVSMGNPHAVVFCAIVGDVDIEKVGPEFETADIFPDRVNTEFVRVVNRRMLKMRVWERGNGETLACGTGACAAAVAAVENGYCDKYADITVKLRGGDLVVNYQDNAVYLTGDAKLVFEGEIEM